MMCCVCVFRYLLTCFSRVWETTFSRYGDVTAVLEGRSRSRAGCRLPTVDTSHRRCSVNVVSAMALQAFQIWTRDEVCAVRVGRWLGEFVATQRAVAGIENCIFVPAMKRSWLLYPFFEQNKKNTHSQMSSTEIWSKKLVMKFQNLA